MYSFVVRVRQNLADVNEKHFRNREYLYQDATCKQKNSHVTVFVFGSVKTVHAAYQRMNNVLHDCICTEIIENPDCRQIGQHE